MTKTGLENGTPPPVIVRYLESLGLSCSARTGMTIADLEEAFAAGNPTIVAIQDWCEPGEYAATMCGHYVVCCGVWGGFVFVQDPSETNALSGIGGAGADGKVAIHASEFVRRWHDVDDKGQKLEQWGCVVSKSDGTSEPETVTEAIRPNRVSSRLATQLGKRQETLLAKTEKAGDAVDKIVASHWKELLELLEQEASRRESDPSIMLPPETAARLAAILNAMQAEVHQSLTADLVAIAMAGHETASKALLDTLPLGYLRSVTADKAPILSARVSESLVQEDEADPTGILVKLGIMPAADPIADLTDAAKKELYGKLLFPPLTFDNIVSILQRPVAGETWEQGLAAATKLADPGVIRSLITTGFSEGKTPAQVAKMLLPAVQGVASTARRVARTYGMAVSHGASDAAHAELDDLIIGTQVHSVVGNPYSRDWHVARSGTIYYKSPGPGQKGMDQCPRPPLEAIDARERPAGAPMLAHNCMCYLTPVFKPHDELAADPNFNPSP